ncbi:MAG: phosphopentomutase [Vampirovibrionales bacterium]
MMMMSLSQTASPSASNKRRAFVVVIDALGVGAMPDAPAYNDSLTCNTLGNIDANAPLALPTLEKLGLGHILPLTQVQAVPNFTAQVAKLAELSVGKDTTTGHWEMMNVLLPEPFPTYPEGFPPDVVEAFLAQTGLQGILGNKPASGTAILDELGQQHLETGFPIIYTSADSVWQVAAHTSITPLETLYQWCEISREILRGQHEVSRVIARPFEGDATTGFKRLGSYRKDYAVEPQSEGNVLVELNTAGIPTLSIGKIQDIFCNVGISHHIKSKDNPHGLQILQDLVSQRLAFDSLATADCPETLKQASQQLIFINLVETDMNYGHRRDVVGYANALEVIDTALAEFVTAMTPDDLLILTGDHGCDPTAPGSDHTREYVPMIAYSPSLPPQQQGTLHGFNHVGQLAKQWFVD